MYIALKKSYQHLKKSKDTYTKTKYVLKRKYKKLSGLRKKKLKKKRKAKRKKFNKKYF